MRHADPHVRDQILAAADRLLTEKGYRAMTVESLAREAKIGKGSVYLHFKSKEDVALAHVDLIVDRLKNRLQEIAASGSPADEKVRLFLLERLTFRYEAIQQYFRSFNELFLEIREKITERRKRYFKEEAVILSKIISDGQLFETFMAGDPSTIAFNLVTATNSLMPLNTRPEDMGSRDELVAQATELVDFLMLAVFRHTAIAANNS